MAEHTLGPWRIDAGIGIVLDNQGEQLAGVSPHNREANARLIAAAPDMLAALRSVRLLMHTGNGDSSDTVIEAVCKAIDKAEHDD